MIKRLSLFFLGLTLTFSFSYAVSICNDNNAVYSDDNLCKSVCSSCSIATLTTTGSVGNCDSAYFNFVYYNGKTYAVTKSLGFWTDFQNLAMPKDAGTNRVISSILPSGSVAWIGVYDSSMHNSYNTVDKSRFVYRDLSSLVYDNFASGEPNNYVDNADYGKVSVLGEHWVAMSSDGTWFDDGYHVSYGNDYKPKYAAVVEWEGPLSCVNVSTSSTPSGGQSSAVNNYCGGKIPCYICAVENSDDTSTIQQCNLSQDNKNYLCPIHQTLCTATYQDPICPTGGNYNVNTKRCEANYSGGDSYTSQDPICPTGGNYNVNTKRCEANYSCPADSYASYLYAGDTPYGFRVSSDRRQIQAFIWSYSYSSNWVDLRSGGVGYVSVYIDNYPYFQVSNYELRVCYGDWSYCGDWVDLCGSGSSVAAYSSDYAIKVEVNNGYLRFCAYNDFTFYTWQCGDWVQFDKAYAGCVSYPSGYTYDSTTNRCESPVCPSGYSFNSTTSKCEASPVCPSGYSFNSTTSKCEADPICPQGASFNSSIGKCYLGDTTCPLGNYPCLKMSDGGSYCSDISCVDGSQSSNYVVDDTQEGANDQRDKGFSNGQCNGTISIFSGRDRRCRPGGLETGGSNCCKKSKTWFGLGKCKASEQELAKLRTTYIKRGGGEIDYSYADANCHYVGSYCSKRIRVVGCVQKKKTFCCFSSPLARIIQEQGRSQLGIGWGEPKNPNCRGFTMDEFQKIDFSKINFDEWINFVMSTSNFTNTFQNSINKTINNIQNSY